MQKKTSFIMKSIGIGMIAGGMSAAIGSKMSSPSRKYKKMVSKAAKSAENIIGSISDAIGL